MRQTCKAPGEIQGPFAFLPPHATRPLA